MATLFEIYESILNDKELIKDVKVIDIKYYAKPLLGNSKDTYDSNIIEDFYEFGQMIDNIANYTGGYDNYFQHYTEDELCYLNFYDINHREIFIKCRIVENVDNDDRYITIDGRDFKDKNSAFEFLNILLVDGKLDVRYLVID